MRDDELPAYIETSRSEYVRNLEHQAKVPRERAEQKRSLGYDERFVVMAKQV